MKEIHYLTVNDLYSGVYRSQVIEVVDHLERQFNVSIKLIAFVPIRIFLAQRKLIKSNKANAKVYPILGSLEKFMRSRLFLKWKAKRKVAICRGPLAFRLANSKYIKIVYDGRSAVAAEVDEYNIAGTQSLSRIFKSCEKEAVEEADFFMAVSVKLVDYWKQQFSVEILPGNHVVIPCTLNANNLNSTRTNNRIKIVYAGGVAGWQSFDKVVKIVREALENQPLVDFVFLCQKVPELNRLLNDFPDRCIQKWVMPEEVKEELEKCDYGILLREKKVTNQVSSPVKFAEYLNAGLKVLISPNIGDFSDFVLEHQCGYIVEDEIPQLSLLTEQERDFNNNLSKSFFDKKSDKVNNGYTKLMKFLQK
jgi:hypothetical protein